MVRQGAEHSAGSVDRRAARPRARLRPRRHFAEADRSRHARHDGRDQHRAHRHRREVRTRHDARTIGRCCRSRGRYVPGGLGGWVIYNKSLPMAPLSCTIEAHERIGAKGDVVEQARRAALREDLRSCGRKNIEALTVSLINSFANDAHEQRMLGDCAARNCREFRCRCPRKSCRRCRSTSARSRLSPTPMCGRACSGTCAICRRSSREDAIAVKLHILRSDGGLASAKSAEEFPVNLLMSGPAGGVTGALWVAMQAGFPNLLTIDVGGTSTDVALIQNGEPRLRRETTVGDVTVRASSVDIRTVGAGGGSIAHVPELTKALARRAAVRGRRSRARRPTTRAARTDRHRCQRRARLPAGDAAPRRRDAARSRAGDGRPCRRSPMRSAMSLQQAALGIYNIVNENMIGALRLVSVEQGHDPRDYALDRVRRCGPAARECAGAAARVVARHHPAGPGRAVRARRCDDGCARRAFAHVRAHVRR